MTFIFNSKKEITDKTKNAIDCQFFLIPEEKTYIHRGTIETIWAIEPFWGRKATRKINDHSITSWVINGDLAYHVQVFSI